MNRVINMTEEELLATGKWKKEALQINIAEVDKTVPSGIRSLTYDMSNTFSHENISQIEAFIREVNRRFPNIKMFVTGTGLVPVEGEENGEPV